MNLPVSKLLRITATFVGILVLLSGILYTLQRYYASVLPRRHDRAPLSSPRLQVEFESGELERALKEKQLRELEGSIEPAIDELLKENAK